MGATGANVDKIVLQHEGDHVSGEADVVANPTARNLIEDVVPGALAAYDLPDLIRLLGDRAQTR